MNFMIIFIQLCLDLIFFIFGIIELIWGFFFCFFVDFGHQRFKGDLFVGEFDISWEIENQSFDGSFSEFGQFLLQLMTFSFVLLDFFGDLRIVWINVFNDSFAIVLQLFLIFSDTFLLFCQKILDLLLSLLIGFWKFH